MRGFHLNLQNCPQVDLNAAVAMLRTAAGLKLNTVLLEYGARFPFEANSAIRDSAALTAEDVQTLNDVAGGCGIRVIPLQQCAAHLEYALHGPHASLRERPEKANLVCPSNPKSLDLFKSLAGEIIGRHPGAEWFHIGGDEARKVGRCGRCAEFLRGCGQGHSTGDFTGSNSGFTGGDARTTRDPRAARTTHTTRATSAADSAGRDGRSTTGGDTCATDFASSTGRDTCATVSKESAARAELIGRHIGAAARWVLEQGLRPVVWDDTFCALPGALAHVPKETIIAYWDYIVVGDPTPVLIPRMAHELGGPRVAHDWTWAIRRKRGRVSDVQAAVMRNYSKPVRMRSALGEAFMREYGRYLGEGFPRWVRALPYLEYYQDRGFDVITCPTGMGNGDTKDGQPNFARFEANIRTHGMRCKANGRALGMITTAWYNVPPEMLHSSLEWTAQAAW